MSNFIEFSQIASNAARATNASDAGVVVAAAYQNGGWVFNIWTIANNAIVTHTLDAYATSEERLVAHARGFIENAGHKVTKPVKDEAKYVIRFVNGKYAGKDENLSTLQYACAYDYARATAAAKEANRNGFDEVDGIYSLAEADEIGDVFGPW